METSGGSNSSPLEAGRSKASKASQESRTLELALSKMSGNEGGFFFVCSVFLFVCLIFLEFSGNSKYFGMA